MRFCNQGHRGEGMTVKPKMYSDHLPASEPLLVGPRSEREHRIRAAVTPEHDVSEKGALSYEGRIILQFALFRCLSYPARR